MNLIVVVRVEAIKTLFYKCLESALFVENVDGLCIDLLTCQEERYVQLINLDLPLLTRTITTFISS